MYLLTRDGSKWHIRNILFNFLIWLPVSIVFSQGSIRGVAWLDQNENGLREAHERGFSGVTVTLMMKQDAAFNHIGDYETEADGQYVFIVPAGEYYLQFALPKGYRFCLAHVSADDENNSDVEEERGVTTPFVLQNGTNLIHVDAGYIQNGGADVSAVMEVLHDNVLVGRDYVYSVKVNNHGPDNALNVALEFNLTTVVELTETNPVSEEPAEGRLRWLFPFLAVGQQQTVLVHVRAMDRGTDIGRCCVNTTSNDPDPTNNCDELLVDVHLPVQISLFEAKSIIGGVQLRWITESETENVGFILFRSPNRLGPYQRIHENLISSKGNSSTRQIYQFVDHSTAQDEKYYYKLADLSYQGQLEYHDPILVETTGPTIFQLLPNYPNPFNTETRIPFILEQEGFVRLDLYNLLGQKMRTLIAASMPSGEQSAIWDGTDDSGHLLPTGAYLCVLQAEHFRQTRIMHLIR